MTATAEKMECTRCGKHLDDEERENPRKDDDGDIICDECHHDKYEFTCCDCQNYGDVEDQHNMLVVFEEVDSMGGPERTVQPGIYRIAEEGSYYGGPIIGEGWLHGERGGAGHPCRSTAMRQLEPESDNGGLFGGCTSGMCF